MLCYYILVKLCGGKLMKSKGFGAIKYQGLLLAAFLVSAAVSIPLITEINDYKFYIYLPDYSIGYCSKLFVGGVLALFKDSFTKEWLYGFMCAAAVAASFVFALFLGKWVSRAPEEMKMPYLVFALFFATSPYAFSVFFTSIGLHDIYWYFFILIALACLRNKVLMWLVPLFSVLCVVVHIGYLVILFPALMIILLYEAVHAQNKGAKTALFILTGVLTVGITVYVLFFEKQTLTMTMNEMLAYTKGKLDVEVGSSGFEYYFYGESADLQPGNGLFIGDSLLSILKTLAAVASEKSIGWIYKSVLAMLPAAGVSVYIFASAARKTKKVSERFVYVLPILMILVLPALWIFSTDVSRWGGLFCISQMLMLVWMLWEKDENVCGAFNKVVAAVKKYPLFAAGALALAYLV